MGDEQIKGMATSLRGKFESLPIAFPYNPCIFKVPNHIFKVNGECYRPTVVSIGPIYYKDPSLEAMEELKLRHLQCFLEHGTNPYTLEHYLNIVRGWEDAIRACYAEQITLSSDEFVKMVLTDAAFILYLWYSFQNILENNPFKNQIVVVFTQVERDLFLEENQLPFFVLNNLYELAFRTSTNNSHVSFIDLTRSYIDDRFVRGKYAINGSIISDEFIEGANYNIKHLVDFLRMYFILPSKLLRQQSDTYTRLTSQDYHLQFPLSVTELSAAGVKFKASKSTSLLDIRFINGVLHIPSFVVKDTTEPLFRSILLFEQCAHYFDSYFIDYIYFLFNLINSPNDVRILVKNGIIDSWLGSDEVVSDMFISITKHIPLRVPNNYYSNVAKELNAYASTPWHRWKAILKKDYFSHPWAIISVVYAFVLLILTLLQTIGTFSFSK
ncbi:hypothetical protein vseg_014149 [Gypsophila vaccaria]